LPDATARRNYNYQLDNNNEREKIEYRSFAQSASFVLSKLKPNGGRKWHRHKNLKKARELQRQRPIQGTLNFYLRPGMPL
jgi:hypothetical protein